MKEKILLINNNDSYPEKHIYGALRKQKLHDSNKTFWRIIKSKDYECYELTLSDSLEELVFPKFDGHLYTYTNMCKSKNLKKIIFPQQYTNIPFRFFQGCKKLEEVVFEGHIEKINYTAFYRTPSLKRVVFKKNTKTEILIMEYYPFGRIFFDKKMVFSS